jgi:hypothetical protein
MGSAETLEADDYIILSMQILDVLLIAIQNNTTVVLDNSSCRGRFITEQHPSVFEYLMSPFCSTCMVSFSLTGIMLIRCL